MEKEIFPKIIGDTGKFFGFEFKGYWIDVGRIDSYIEVHKFLLKNKRSESFLGENYISYGMLTNSSMGDNVIVGVNTKIDSSVIFNNVDIGENVVIDNCIIGENCKIGDDTILSNTVVGDNEVVMENRLLENEIVWTHEIPKGYPNKQIGNVIGE